MFENWKSRRQILICTHYPIWVYIIFQMKRAGWREGERKTEGIWCCYSISIWLFWVVRVELWNVQKPLFKPTERHFRNDFIVMFMLNNNYGCCYVLVIWVEFIRMCINSQFHSMDQKHLHFILIILLEYVRRGKNSWHSRIWLHSPREQLILKTYFRRWE